MRYQSKLRKNIVKNYLYTFLKEFNFTSGIWMIYLASKGLSLSELGIIEGIFHITSFLMEIPTGAVADIWGRKVSRILGRVFSLISSVIMLFSNSYIGFVIGFIVSAVSYNLESGAGDALVYDSLKELNEENTYMRISGMNELIMQISNTGGLIIGGILSKYNYTYAYIGAAIIGLVTLIQCISFVEPMIEEKIERKNYNMIRKQVVESFKIITLNKKIGFLILFSQGIFMFNTSIFFYFQNYMLGNGISQDKIGIILAIASLAAAVVGANAFRIEKRIGELGVIVFIPILISIFIWGAALSSRYYFIFFIAISAMESLVYVAVGDYINKEIPSDKRATILSMGSMIFSGYMIVVFPLIGRIGDLYSLKTSFEVLAFISSIMALSCMFVFRKKNM